MSEEEIEIRIIEEEVASNMPEAPKMGDGPNVPASPDAPTPPLVPDGPIKPTMKERASQAMGKVGEQAKHGAKKAWQSEIRKKATRTVGRGVAKVAKKGSAVVTDVVVKTAEKQARQQATAVQQKIQETDWKEVSKEGTATGLRWLSRKFADLAQRFKKPESDEQNETEL